MIARRLHFQHNTHTHTHTLPTFDTGWFGFSEHPYACRSHYRHRIFKAVATKCTQCDIVSERRSSWQTSKRWRCHFIWTTWNQSRFNTRTHQWMHDLYQLRAGNNDIKVDFHSVWLPATRWWANLWLCPQFHQICKRRRCSAKFCTICAIITSWMCLAKHKINGNIFGFDLNVVSNVK